MLGRADPIARLALCARREAAGVFGVDPEEMIWLPVFV
jgi:hypothetical protein